MKGKEKCEFLKKVRKEIADMNNIKYNLTPCNHSGDCLGYCSQCDKESDYILQEVKKKEAASFPVYIDGKFPSKSEENQQPHLEIGMLQGLVRLDVDVDKDYEILSPRHKKSSKSK